MLSRWVVAASAVVVLAALSSSCKAVGVDPAPPDFLVGSSSKGGTVDLHIVDCGGGTLRSLTVKSMDSGDVRTPVWELKSDSSGSGLRLEPGREQVITIGKAPPGLREALPLAGPLPTDRKMAVTVGETGPEFGYGYFFTARDIPEGMIQLEAGKAVTATEFEAEARATCAAP